MKKTRLFALILCAGIALSALSGCKKVFDTAADVPLFPVLINGIVIDERPTRVACLSESIYEIAADFGYADQIAFAADDITSAEGDPAEDTPPEESGSSEESTDDISAAEPINIGTAAAPNVEGLIAAAPDLIVTTQRLSKRDLERLSASELKVIILETAKNFAELETYYKNIATIFGGVLSSKYDNIVVKDGTAVSTGEDVAKLFYNDVSALVESRVSNRKPSFVYVLSVSPPIAATSDTFAGDIMSRFGENLGEGTSVGVATGFVGTQPSRVFAALPLGGSNLDPLDLGAAPDDVISLDNSAFMLQSPSKLISVINVITERM